MKGVLLTIMGTILFVIVPMIVWLALCKMFVVQSMQGQSQLVAYIVGAILLVGTLAYMAATAASMVKGKK